MLVFLNLRRTALLIFGAAVATIGGALMFEYGFGLTPCKLCLLQRNPYYLSLPLALAAALAPQRMARMLLAVVGVIFVVSVGMGVYHAGVEWGFWLGPSDCGGTGAAPSNDGIGAFLERLENTRVVSCTEAAWRFLGLSLAGWNVLISLALSALAFRSAASPGSAFTGASARRRSR